MKENLEVGEGRHKRFRAIQFSAVNGGESWRDWLWLIWGMDAWFGNVPFFKVMVLLNVLVWVMLWLWD